MKDIIELTINGNKYTAERVVTGVTKVRQKLIFMDREETDDATYSKSDAAQMKIMAESILYQLVTEGSLGHSALEPRK